MGKFSRDKGRRAEYALRDYLRDIGYAAVRVPLSGASEGYKSDVVANRDGASYSFEMKARQSEFNKIYALYFKYRYAVDKTFRFSLRTKHGKSCFAISENFEAVKETNHHFKDLVPEAGEVRTFGKIVRMYDLLQGADFLVIKDNNHPMLFLKYWL